MPSTYSRTNRAPASSIWFFWFGFLTLVFMGTPISALARCMIPFPDAATLPTIDGQINDAEWLDSEETSTEKHGCFDGLVPVDARTMRDADNLYFALKVKDQTLPRASYLGERVIIRLSPGNLDGSTLSSPLGSPQSYLINVGHKWTQTTLDADRSFRVSSGQVACPKDSPAGAPNGVTVSTWEDQGWPNGLEVKIGNVVSGKGYELEFKIPKTAIGIIGKIPNAIAFAFVVVDDSTPRDEPTKQLAFASWFPIDLEVEQADKTTGALINPANDPLGGACDQWNQTKNWGLASGKRDVPVYSVGEDVNAVYISRKPNKYASEDIDVVQCPDYAGRGDQYTYFPGAPCRMKVKYRLRNTKTVAQRVDVLVLATVPLNKFEHEYRVLEFREGVTVPAAPIQNAEASVEVVTTTLDGADFAFAPTKGTYGAPCVSVYILPRSDSALFPKSLMRTTTTYRQDQLEDLKKAYKHDEGTHEAWLNVSQLSFPTNVCPTPSCRGASLDGPSFAAMGVALSRPIGITLRFLEDELLPVAHAEGSATPLSDRLSDVRDDKPGKKQEGPEIPLSDLVPGVPPIPQQLIERFGASNVIVRIDAHILGSDANIPGRYNITRNLVSMFKLIPVNVLLEKNSLLFDVFIANDKTTPQIVFLKAVVQVPHPPLWVGPGPELMLARAPRMLAPGASYMVQGRIGKPCECGDLGCFVASGQFASNSSLVLVGSLAIFGTLGVGGIAFLRRRKDGTADSAGRSSH